MYEKAQCWFRKICGQCCVNALCTGFWKLGSMLGWHLMRRERVFLSQTCKNYVNYINALLQDRTSGCKSESVFKLKHFHKGRCWIARLLKMRQKANEEMVQWRSVTDLVSQAPSSSVAPETQKDFYCDPLKWWKKNLRLPVERRPWSPSSWSTPLGPGSYKYNWNPLNIKF